MDFITIPFQQADPFLQALIALAGVIVLILIVAWVFKLFTGGGRSSGRGRNRRLMVVDALAIDPKRQLMLVRRDDVDHLIVVGGATDLVIETHIPIDEPGAPARQTRRTAAQRQPAPAPVAPAAPVAPGARAEPDPAPSRLSPLARLREMGDSGAQHRPAPLRHPGLAENVAPSGSDSAKDGVVTPPAGPSQFDPTSPSPRSEPR